MTTWEIIGLSLALLVMLAGLIGSLVPGFPGTPVVLAAAVVHRLCFGPDSASNFDAARSGGAHGGGIGI